MISVGVQFLAPATSHFMLLLDIFPPTFDVRQSRLVTTSTSTVIPNRYDKQNVLGLLAHSLPPSAAICIAR